MPRASSLLVSFTLLALIATPGRSAADPIDVRIMSGSLNADGPGATLSLVGDHGFTFEGFVHASGGRLGPWSSCTPCGRGDPVSLTSTWSGLDLHGTVTFQGKTYRMGGLRDDDAVGIVTFTGPTVIAPLEGTTATLVAPFTFEGQFGFPTLEPVFHFAPATARGVGTATVGLTFNPDNFWGYRSVVYEFEPIPEPGTMLLVGTALAGLGLRQRRRQ